MITDEERIAFCKATAAWNGNDYDNEFAQVCEPEQVAAIRYTLSQVTP